MNLLSKAKNEFRLSIRTIMVLFVLVAILTIFPQVEYAQTKLTLADIFTGLRSKKVDLEERNRLLTEAIKTRGITFTVTSDIEKELEETGADKSLIEAVKERSIVAKPVSTPVPASTPAPMPTPVSTPTQPSFLLYQKNGDSNFVKGDYDLAVVNYNKAIDLNPKEASIYLSRGLVYYNRKFYELAIADYSKVIEIDPEELMAYHYRGDSYERLREFQKAADDYKKIIELDSDNLTAKANLQRVEAEINRNKAKETAVASTTSEPAKTTEESQPVSKTEENSSEQMVEVGSLIGIATRLVQPSYPLNARSLRIDGEVSVSVIINEEGNPIEVKVINGHPYLRQVCEDAVKKSKFKPVMINNKAVKAKGFVTYKFKSN